MSIDARNKAEALFKELLELCNTVSNSPSTSIPFDSLKKLKFLAKTDDVPIIDFLFKRQTIDQINNQGNAQYEISQEEFVDLVSGTTLTDVLYKKNIEDQRFYVEDFTQLYRALGGKDSTGIPKTNLRRNLKNYFDSIGVKDKHVDDEIEEIYQYLKSADNNNNEVITLSEFVKVMTAQED